MPFDRIRLKQGLEKACWKRPISDGDIESVLTEVETYIEANCESEVESRYLGELVMEQLRDLDQVAYVRFASRLSRIQGCARLCGRVASDVERREPCCSLGAH